MARPNATRPGRLPFLSAALVVMCTAACGTQSARSPHTTKPLDEGRAVAVIQEALRKEGLEPAPPTKSLSSGKPLTLDVPVQGKKIAVAYLSPNDLTELGDSPLASKKKLPGDPLRIETSSGEGAPVRFVVLYCTDYIYDDTVGAEHDTTAITAEAKLARDVRDFIVIARRERFE